MINVMIKPTKKTFWKIQAHWPLFSVLWYIISNNYKTPKNHNIILIKFTFGKSIMQVLNFQIIHSIKRWIFGKISLYYAFKKCLNWLVVTNKYLHHMSDKFFWTELSSKFIPRIGENE